MRRAEADQIRAHSGLLPQLSAAASCDRSLASEFDNVFNTEKQVLVSAPRAQSAGRSRDARVAEIERAIDCGAVGGGGSSGRGGLQIWRISHSVDQHVASLVVVFTEPVVWWS